MKPHEYSKLLAELTKVAKSSYNHQSLREQLSTVLKNNNVKPEHNNA